MKIFALFLIFFIFSFSVFSQSAESYYVIRIRGNIRNLKTNQLLKTGDKISAEDRLDFTDTETAAIVMSTEKGRLVLKKNPKSYNSAAALWSYVKNNLLPLPKRQSLSTRGGGTEAISDLGEYFINDTYVIIGKEVKLTFDPNHYPLSANRFVGVQYSYQGKSISKKLSQEGKVVKFNVDSLFWLNKKSIIPDSAVAVRFFYMNPQKKTSGPAESLDFKLIVVNENALKEQLIAVVKACKEAGQSKEQIKTQIIEYIQDVYGKPDSIFLETWIEKNKFL